MSFFRPIRSRAESLAEHFSGKVKDTGSFLNEYRYFIEFKLHGLNVCIELHYSLKQCRIRMPFKQKNNPFVCSFGGPVNFSFDTLVKPPKIKDPFPIYTMSTLSNEYNCLETIYQLLSDENNYKDIEDLQLKEGEHFAMYADAFDSKFLNIELESLRQRVIILVNIMKRIGDTSASPVFDPRAYQMVVGEPIEEDQGKQPKSNLHSFGGVSRQSMPACCNCDHSLHVIATIDLDDPKLDFDKKHRGCVYVVTCLNCDSYREPIFIKYSTKSIEVIEQATGQSFGEFPEILPKRELLLKPIDESSLSEESSEIKHQIGGTPSWIQQPDYVYCPKCEKEMKFLAQISTDDELNIQFGDDGCLYCFICEKCKVLATFVQGY